MPAMYVCLCHEVTESQVRDAISAGACTVEQLRAKLKVSNCCGSCEPTVAECLAETLNPHHTGSARPRHAGV